uniref:B2_Vc1 prepropeptide n=1 Tax=Conus victoriae TaxID=319920 RepID=W4VS93_CONVC
MLRLIIAAVLVCACLAYPQKRDGAPADAANLQGFDQGMMAMPNMQPMQPVPMMQGPFMPFNPGFGGMGYKRDLDEDPEQKRHHSQFNEDNISPFNTDEGLGNFMNFMNDNGNSLPFANVNSDDLGLDSFQPSAGKEEGKFRFFDGQQ